MERRITLAWLATGVLGLGLGLGPGRAHAQFGPTGGAQTPPTGTGGGSTPGVVSPYSGTSWAGMAVNPLMNPYMNPYINPLATQTQQQVSAGNAALFFLAAQQMNGGIGSGRLGGPQAGQIGSAARGGRPATASNRPGAAAEAARGGGANTPGAGASRYFSRNNPTNVSAGHYYGRQNGHFPRLGK